MPNEGYPYLSDLKADVRLLGCIPLLNPFPDHVSSQRGMMLSNHIPQSQLLIRNEFPRIFSGFEPQTGEYEASTSNRDEDVIVLWTIPKFRTQQGSHPLRYNPVTTVIYLGRESGQFGCFDIEGYTARSDNYGYTNIMLNTQKLESNYTILKEDKLVTSPAHHGNMYNLGTNLRIAYMSLPHVTEDAWVISESAAAKLATEGFSTCIIDIHKDQIPLNLYGDDEEEYKIFPDIGDEVRSDGVICALRKPSADSFIYDTCQANLSEIQPLHDTKFYAPPGATVVDVRIHINRKTRSKMKVSEAMIEQCEKYRGHLSNYYNEIWECYRKITERDSESKLTPHFNLLVADAICELQVDGRRIRGFTSDTAVQPIRKKEVIEFIHIELTYKYTRKLNKGFKLSGRYGN